MPKALSLILFPLFIAAVVTLALVFRHDILGIVRDREAFRAWIGARGRWAVPLFILFQFLQVAVFVIPGEVAQLAGGWAFGTGGGILWSLAGIGLGSAFNFFVARFLGEPFILAIAGLSRLGFPQFLLISMLGRLPGIAGSALMGDAAGRGSWTLLVILGSVAIILFALGLIFHGKIHAWVERLAARRRRD